MNVCYVLKLIYYVEFKFM